MRRTLPFLRQFLRPRPGALVRRDTHYRRGDDTIPATLYHPAGLTPRTPLPGWMALHGLTCQGRDHPSLDRFARALAASGAVVLVPDLPEWRALRIAPEATARTIKAAALELDAVPLTAPGRVGVIGFSFGATQALIAATDPLLHGHVSVVAAWGGYADIHRATRFAFLGSHELDGRTYRLSPDPYGRWILAGNYLPCLPEHRDDQALADALLGIAMEAGRRTIMSWSPETDRLKVEARRGLSARQREVFDLIAPPANRAYTDDETERVERLAVRLSAAAVAHEPLLDPSEHLSAVSLPVFLAHGRNDRLVPWTEVVRLRRALPAGRVTHTAITSLFAHSFGERRFPTPGRAIEVLRFVRMLRRMLRLI